MSQDTRVGEEWLVAAIGVNIRSANTDIVDTNEGFVGPRLSGPRGLLKEEMSRFFEDNGVHAGESVKMNLLQADKFEENEKCALGSEMAVGGIKFFE